MGTIVSFLFPAALLLCCLRVFQKEKINLKHMAYYFAMSVWTINSLAFSVVYVTDMTSPNKENVISRMNASWSFVLKYIVLSLLISLLLLIFHCVFKRFSFGFKFIKEHERLFITVFAFILVVINFFRIFDDNYWYDEAYSIDIVKKSFADMIQTTAGDVHPPLYYIFLMLNCRIFGYSAWVYRITSFIPYILIIMLALSVVWKCFGRELSIILIAFSSLSLTSFVFSVEIRMYSLALTLVFLSFMSLLRIIEDSCYKNCFIFVIISLMAAFTHYYALITVAFLYASLIVLVCIKKLDLIKLIIVYLSTIIIYLPWAIVFLNTVFRTSKGYWQSIDMVPSFIEGMEYCFPANNAFFSLGLFILAVALLALRIKKEGILSNISLWLVFGSFAIVGTFVTGKLFSTLVFPSFLDRYFYPATVIIWVILGVNLTYFKKEALLVWETVLLSIVVLLLSSICIEVDDVAIIEKCDSTLEGITKLIPDEAIIVTDNELFPMVFSSHFENREYLVFDYYADERVTFDKAKNYVYFSSFDLPLTETEIYFNEIGYSVSEIYHDGLLADVFPIHLYEMIPQ